MLFVAWQLHNVVDYPETTLFSYGGCSCVQPLVDVRTFAAAVTQATGFTCAFAHSKSLQDKFGIRNNTV